MAVNQKTELMVKAWRPYTTQSPVSDSTATLSNIVREFQRLQATITGLVDASPQATDVAPLNPRNGLIRYATGAWATALGAEGFYGYKSGVWTLIV